MDNRIILLQLSALFLLLFAVAELLYHKAKIRADYTRNLVHTGTGLLTLLFPVYFTHLWQVIIICMAFLLILVISMRYKLLPSINAVSRTTAGSVLYPVIVTGVFAFYLFMARRFTHYHPYLFFYMPVLIMAVADPVAALAGNYFSRRAPGKTIIGSVAFFMTAFVISFFLFYFLGNILLTVGLVFSFFISLATAITERVSTRGWDNFTIPAVTALLLYLMA